MLTLIGFILLLGVIIFLHEGGHFLAAKRLGVFVHEFSLGMGPVLFQRKKGETRYSLRWFPIGGFVNLATKEMAQEILEPGDPISFEVGQDGKIHHILVDAPAQKQLSCSGVVIESKLYKEKWLYFEASDGVKMRFEAGDDLTLKLPNGTLIEPVPLERCLETQARWKQLVIVLAGVFVNFLFALLCFIVLAGVKGHTEYAPIIAGVVPGSYAETVGLQAGDELVAINDQSFTYFSELSATMGELEQEVHQLTIQREGETHILTLEESAFAEAGALGLRADREQILLFERTLPQMLRDGAKSFSQSMAMMTDSIQLLVTGKASINELGGVVSIYKMTESAFTQGLSMVLYWFGFLSLNVGFMNLSPIPPLDGCQGVFIVIEAVLGRELSVQTKSRCLKWGMYGLIAFSLYLTAVDILRYLG